jgi:hypothetical protein
MQCIKMPGLFRQYGFIGLARRMHLTALMQAQTLFENGAQAGFLLLYRDRLKTSLWKVREAYGWGHQATSTQ